MEFGCREDEDDMRGRLFESFEERVPGARGEHVDLVYDENFLLAQGGRELHGFAELADILDAVVGRAVYFNRIESAAIFEAKAVGTRVAGLCAVTTIRAVERFCQEAGDRGFAGAARTGEEVGVRQEILLERVGQGRDDMRLPRDVAPVFGSVFSIEGRHREMQNAK